MASIPGWGGSPAAGLSQLGSKFSNFVSGNRNAVGACAATAIGLGLAATAAKSYVVRQDALASPQEKLAELLWDDETPRCSSFASLSLSSKVSEPVERRSGFAFPYTSEEGQELVGTGKRRVFVMGWNRITAYTFGVYVDPESLKATVPAKCERLSSKDIKPMPGVLDDVARRDVSVTVRLVVVYRDLQTENFRTDISKFVRRRLKRFSAENNVKLLESFASGFKDGLKIPRGTTIEFIRLPGQILQTKVEGQEVSRVQSALICRAVFDLFLGNEAYDLPAREKIRSRVTHLLFVFNRDKLEEGTHQPCIPEGGLWSGNVFGRNLICGSSKPLNFEEEELWCDSVHQDRTLDCIAENQLLEAQTKDKLVPLTPYVERSEILLTQDADYTELVNTIRLRKEVPFELKCCSIAHVP